MIKKDLRKIIFKKKKRILGRYHYYIFYIWHIQSFMSLAKLNTINNMCRTKHIVYYEKEYKNNIKLFSQNNIL